MNRTFARDASQNKKSFSFELREKKKRKRVLPFHLHVWKRV